MTDRDYVQKHKINPHFGCNVKYQHTCTLYIKFQRERNAGPGGGWGMQCLAFNKYINSVIKPIVISIRSMES